MGTFNSPMQSMTFEEDAISQAAATENHGTLYELTNYSGAGRLFEFGYYNAGAVSYTDLYMVITTDGNAKIFDPLDASVLTPWRAPISNHYILFSWSLEFTSSLVIQIANDNVAAQNIAGQSIYGILSKEFKRELIPAGQPVPDKDGNPRPNTYPFDVMLVWFEGGHGKSNKVQFPASEKLDLSAGRLMVPAGFNLNVGAERYNFAQSAESKIITETIEGEPVEIEVVNGIIQVIPKFIRVVDFWDRFTEAEQESLQSSASTKVKNFLYKLRMLEKINLTGPKIIAIVNALETASIIGAGRAAEILVVA